MLYASIIIAGALIALAISSLKEPLTDLSKDIKWLKDYVEKRARNKWDETFYVQK